MAVPCDVLETSDTVSTVSGNSWGGDVFSRKHSEVYVEDHVNCGGFQREKDGIMQQ